MVNISQIRRLATREDADHIHKALGVAVLCHLVYRMNYIIKYGDSGLLGSPLTPTWMAFHALLHVSSFQFALPAKRNMVYNVIWPEFRLHSMIFAYRSIVNILALWYGVQWTRGLVVLGTMAAADIVTCFWGQHTTMRGNPYARDTPASFVTWHNRFYSMSQFGATMAIMFRGVDSAFMALLPIQTAPFLMTLVKKGIINQTEWHIWYTLGLLANWVHALFGKGNDGNLLANWQYALVFISATIARLYFRINKYIIWSAAWLLSILALKKLDDGGIYTKIPMKNLTQYE